MMQAEVCFVVQGWWPSTWGWGDPVSQAVGGGVQVPGEGGD